MPTLRRRQKETKNGFTASSSTAAEIKTQKGDEGDRDDKWSLTNTINILVGAVLALFVGVAYSLYARQIHENDMWFSNIGVSRNTL